MNKPTLRDALLAQTPYLPAAAATNYSDAFDLGDAEPDSRAQAFRITVPALANHTDNTKTILLTLQDSADGDTFADVAPLQQAQVVGVAATGSLAKELWMHAPPGVRRYVRFSQVVPAGAGDNTASQVAYDLLGYN